MWGRPPLRGGYLARTPLPESNPIRMKASTLLCGLPVSDQQLHVLASAKVVDFELIRGMNPVRRCLAGITAEMDSGDRAAALLRNQSHLQVTFAYDAPLADVEHIVEHRFGKALPPRSGHAQAFRQIAREVAGRQLAVAQNPRMQPLRIQL